MEANPELEDVLPGYYFGDFNMPGLAIESVASLTPEDIEIYFTDDHFENIDFEEKVDLVAITAFTPQASRAYKISDKFRERGVPVVMGGIHPTLMPEEAAIHASHIVIGQANGSWQTFLDDFKRGIAQKFYRNMGNGPFLFPFPRREFFRKKGYVLNSIIVVSRGCRYSCPTCIIPLVDGRETNLRPIDEVVKDIRCIDAENIFIADDAPFFMEEKYKKYANELFTALSPYKKKFFVTAVMLMSLTDEELKLAYKAGVREVYIVFAFPPIALSLLTKDLEKKVLDSLKRIHDNGLEIFGSFGLGFDYDDKGIFEKSVQFAHKAECDMVEFFIATPFPRTPFWTRLKAEARLLHQDWGLYNSANVVFRPKNMEAYELHEGYIQCWKEFYSKYSFNDFSIRFSRYWGMNKDKLRQVHNRKRAIKEKDILQDA
ncbi:MAG: B12-binding domain-containing radical SAM protein [bacterium]